MRADHANYSIGCIPTYLIYSSVKPFLITALNCLNTEIIPAHSEKYTVRGSIARAREPRNSGIVTSIYIVANGNDHVMRNFKWCSELRILYHNSGMRSMHVFQMHAKQ